MANLKDDPKVQALIEKAETAAAKAERKRVTDILKDAKTATADIEDKGQKKAVVEAIKTITDEVKAA